MAINNGSTLLLQFSYFHKVKFEIRQRYKLNTNEFLILCTGSSLQTTKENWFFVPELKKRFTSMNETQVYRHIKTLCSKGYVKKSRTTIQMNKANYYIITGNGERVLSYFIERMNNI